MWQHHHTKRLLGKFKKNVSITALVYFTVLSFLANYNFLVGDLELQ